MFKIGDLEYYINKRKRCKCDDFTCIMYSIVYMTTACSTKTSAFMFRGNCSYMNTLKRFPV